MRHRPAHSSPQVPQAAVLRPRTAFDYSGTTTLTVNNGDTFGFTITGSNGDLNSFLRGTLRVAMNVVKNGSFETPLVHSGGFDTIPTDADAPVLTDWTIDSGNIDLLNPTYWNASDGNQSIDLDGYDAGSISQVLPTVVGQKYDVKFPTQPTLKARTRPRRWP